jgi:peroxiredoxin
MLHWGSKGCTLSRVVAQWRVPGLDATALLLSQMPWHSSRECGLLVTALVDRTPTKRRKVAKRSVFVIDRQGIVRYRWVTDDALVLPDFDAAIAMLRQL